MLTMPSDLWIEKLVLGAVLLNAPANWPTVANLLQPADFSVAAHQMIFARSAEIVADSGKLDRVTLIKALMERGELESVGGMTYLVTLEDGLPQLYNLDEYCTQLRASSLLRIAILELQAGVEQLCGAGAGLDTLESVQASISALESSAKSRVSGFRPVRDVVDSPEDGGTQAFFQPSVQEIGIPWPWPKVTDAAGGFLAGEIVVISAASGVGKTTAATQCVLHAAELGHLCAILTLEMGARQVVRKIIAQRGGVCLSDWMQGRSGREDRNRIQYATGEVVQMPIYIDDDRMVTPASLDARIAALPEPPRVVMVDYLQLMQSGIVDKWANREQHVAHISRQLKLLAGKYKCTVLALSQVNADGNVRESSAIANDATQVIRLDRKEFGRVDVLFMKARFSARTKLSLQFDGRTGLFSEWEANAK
jgi:replicative DNA helicase